MFIESLDVYKTESSIKTTTTTTKSQNKIKIKSIRNTNSNNSVWYISAPKYLDLKSIHALYLPILTEYLQVIGLSIHKCNIF